MKIFHFILGLFIFSCFNFSLCQSKQKFSNSIYAEILGRGKFYSIGYRAAYNFDNFQFNTGFGFMINKSSSDPYTQSLKSFPFDMGFSFGHSIKTSVCAGSGMSLNFHSSEYADYKVWTTFVYFGFIRELKHGFEISPKIYCIGEEPSIFYPNQGHWFWYPWAGVSLNYNLFRKK
ncbi:MAG: hypothetical protein IPM77_13090 [Crocinitomicaceae bacterium]|nr:hypothetical protein [Crocinitomicaceae bacterium]